MNTATVAHWTHLVNTRVGTSVTDATPAEVKKAMKALSSNMGSSYTKTFLKQGRVWRKWPDSDDINYLIDYVQNSRGQ